MKRSWLILCLTVAAYKTGSNFENLQANASSKGNEVTAITGTYWLRPFAFRETHHRSEMFRKAFVLPGYKGIDFDGYGRMAASDEKTGMRTIYSTPEVHLEVAEALRKLGATMYAGEGELPDTATEVKVTVQNSESSLRMHTYGCWPFVGFFVYLVNGDIYTVLIHTKLDYQIGAGRRGTLNISTRKEFGFWTSYAGMEILESFTEAQQQHVQELAAALAAELQKATATTTTQGIP